MKAKYPKINVGITPGYPGVLAFVFTKNGTRVYFGSYDKIKKWLCQSELCHGIVLSYHNKRIFNRSWMLFGYGSEARYNGTYFTLQRTNAHKWNSFGFANIDRLIPAGMTETRNTWYLLKHNSQQGTPIIYGRWRKLPQQYLKQLAGVDY